MRENAGLDLIPVGRSLVDTNSATIDLSAIHQLESIAGCIAGVESHETEATGTSGVAVHDDFGVNDRARGALVKGSVQRSISSAPGEISYKEAVSFVSHGKMMWSVRSKGNGRSRTRGQRRQRGRARIILVEQLYRRRLKLPEM